MPRSKTRVNFRVEHNRLILDYDNLRYLNLHNRNIFLEAREEFAHLEPGSLKLINRKIASNERIIAANESRQAELIGAYLHSIDSEDPDFYRRELALNNELRHEGQMTIDEYYEMQDRSRMLAEIEAMDANLPDSRIRIQKSCGVIVDS